MGHAQSFGLCSGCVGLRCLSKVKVEQFGMDIQKKIKNFDKKEGLDPRLLDVLVCPLTKKPLVYDRENQELISTSAGLAYPIRQGIPIMLIEEARSLEEEKL